MGFVEQQPKIGKEDAEDKDDASSSADDWPVLVLVPVLVLMVDRSLLLVHSFMEYDWPLEKMWGSTGSNVGGVWRDALQDWASIALLADVVVLVVCRSDIMMIALTDDVVVMNFIFMCVLYV